MMCLISASRFFIYTFLGKRNTSEILNWLMQHTKFRSMLFNHTELSFNWNLLSIILHLTLLGIWVYAVAHVLTLKSHIFSPTHPLEGHSIYLHCHYYCLPSCYSGCQKITTQDCTCTALYPCLTYGNYQIPDFWHHFLGFYRIVLCILPLFGYVFCLCNNQFLILHNDVIVWP